MPHRFSAILCALLGSASHAQECRPYWALVPRLQLPGVVTELPVFDDGTGPAVYSYEFLPDWSYRPVAWTGKEWTPLSYAYPSGSLGPFAVLDDGAGRRLYGRRNMKGTIETFKWDGISWEMLPAAFGERTSVLQLVYGMYSHDDGNGSKIYGFREVRDPFYRRVVVRWDGGSWVVIGSPASSANLNAMVTHDDGSGSALYVCGDFSSMNGVPAHRIARWRNGKWSAVGDGLIQGPVAMVSLDMGSGPRLYTLGGVPGPNNEWQVMVWDGQTWSTIGGASAPPGVVYSCPAMVAFDDGTGPGLVVAGNMPYMGGVLVRGAARWNGQTWSAMGAGIRTPTGGLHFERLVVCPDLRGPSLFAVGADNGFGGGELGGIAQWVGCPNCYANCDLSTVPPVLNVADFICFITKFAAKDPYANCTVDATIDITDFTCFLNKFAAGCM